MFAGRFAQCRAGVLATATVSLMGPFLASAADGSRCARCHPVETAAFLASPMGRSIVDPAAEPEGRYVAPKQNFEATVRHRKSAAVLEMESAGIHAKWPIAYSVGAGIVGRTDIVQVGEYLFQSPVSWYTKPGGWGLSPGYENRGLIDVDRPIVAGCLFCHTGSIRLKAGTENRFEDRALTAISCERCHGPAAEHLARPVPGSIVNPARLSGPERDSICEQCHLEGESRILNPGRDWWDFRPGAKTEDVFVTYVKATEHQQHFHAVSHSEQLAESRCAPASGGKLWCGSCHDPHTGGGAQPARITSVCLGCHQPLFTAARHRPASQCTSCHMPRLRADNVAHTAVTDHRIPKMPEADDKVANQEAFSIRPWRTTVPGVEDRDDGLAMVEVGSEHHNAAQIREGYRVLAAGAEAGRSDGAQLEAMAAVMLDFGQPERAVALLEQAARDDSRDAALAWRLGVTLEKAGNLAGAIRQLTRAIQIDRSLPEPYLELARIYSGMGNQALRRAVLTEYLKFMPQSVRFRQELNQPSDRSAPAN